MKTFTRILILGATSFALAACSQTTKEETNEAANSAADDAAANTKAAGDAMEQSATNAGNAANADNADNVDNADNTDNVAVKVSVKSFFLCFIFLQEKLIFVSKVEKQKILKSFSSFRHDNKRWFRRKLFDADKQLRNLKITYFLCGPW